MILLRSIRETDVDGLERLSQIPGFINLTGDKDALKDKIRRSMASFARTPSGNYDEKYLFVAEDTATKQVIGTSMVAAQHGTAESPHFYFEVGTEEKFSETINTGFIHGTLKLKYEIDGPSEIGGLVLDPELRNSPQRVGRQISFVRFLFMGLHRARFKKKVLAELLPPLNKKGQSPLWEAIGRRFTNMDYWEADQLCQKNKEFIFSLFPTGKIYTTFLTAEARHAIGKVGKETDAVKHMLEKIGFQYRNQVDPFDGGPHLWANVDDLVPLKRMRSLEFDRTAAAPSEKSPAEQGILCAANQALGEFRALAVQATVDGNRVRLVDPDTQEASALLGLSSGDPVVFMSYY